MKKIHLFLNVFSVLLDYSMLCLAGMLAYLIRYSPSIQEVRPIIFDLPLIEYRSLVLSVAVFWILFFALFGLYTTTYRQRVTAELARVLAGCSLGFLALITFLFWSRELFSSRFIMLVAWVLAITLVSLGRIGLRLIRRALLRHNIGATRVVLVGIDQTAKDLQTVFTEQPTWGFKVIASLPNFDIPRLNELLIKEDIDEIIFVDVSLARIQRLEAYEYCIENHLGFRYVPDMFAAQSHNVSVQTVGGIPVIEIKKTPLDGWGRIAKRLFDIIFSIVLLIIISPLWLMIVVAIKIDDPGPVIYKNVRLGKNGKEFLTYKFRYLKTKYCTGPGYDSDGSAARFERELIQKYNVREGGLYKIANDPRKSNIGTLLEKFSLDEIPQLVNVLIGNMSLVGPRPHQRREVEQFPRLHERVLAIKPGMTGLAQISGRSDLSVMEELKLDTLYIENWSLTNDINIILRTPLALLKRRSN